MDRRNAYYRQLVAEADVDEWFDLAENADRALMVDTGAVGIVDGLDITEAGVPNLTVECDAGAAYDQTGQRLYVPSLQVVNVAVDKDGLTTAVSNPGNIKWVSVFLKFKRTLSNPKTDGNNVTIQYDRDESFEFIVEQSTEDVAPSRPALKGDAILLADIQRNHSDTAVNNADISTTRRQWAFDVSAGSYSIKKGQAEEAVGEMLTLFNTHVTGLAASTGAALVGYNGGGTWADGTTNPATTVEAQLDKVISDLAGATGSAKIYSALQDAGGGYSLSAGTLASQLLALITKQKDHETDTSAAHAASAIDFVPGGTLVATNVQTALEELRGDKGELSGNNAWTGTNSFAAQTTVNGGLTMIPTNGNDSSYIKHRSQPSVDATDDTLFTYFFRREGTYNSGAVIFQAFDASDIPQNTQINLHAVVTFVDSGNVDVATYQMWHVAFKKVGTTSSEVDGGASGEHTTNRPGSGGHQATGVSWAGTALGVIQLLFTAAAGGRVCVSGTCQISRYD